MACRSQNLIIQMRIPEYLLPYSGKRLRQKTLANLVN